MYRPLAPCASCSRHVRTSEAACPFCAAPLTNRAIPIEAPGTTQRVSRAAAFALTASLAVTGCGGTVVQGAPGDSGPRDGSSKSDATTDGAPDDEGGPLVHYGAPPYGLPPGDAAPPEDAGADDASDGQSPTDSGNG